MVRVRVGCRFRCRVRVRVRVRVGVGPSRGGRLLGHGLVDRPLTSTPLQLLHVLLLLRSHAREARGIGGVRTWFGLGSG